MADDDSLLTNPPSQDAAWHVHDYLRFTRLVKLVTGIVLVIGLFVLWIL